MKRNCLFLVSLLGLLAPVSAQAEEEGVRQPKEKEQQVAVGQDEQPQDVDGSVDRKKWKHVMKVVDPSLKFGGYITGKYSISDRSGENSNGGFDLRYLRLYANGYCFKDFYYRFQVEVCGSPGVDKGVRVLDAFVEWQKFDYLRVKMGQFKRSFGFENPYSPLNVGLGSYSQATTLLAGMSDRVGEHGSGGRDLGFQVQGDLLKDGNDGHAWLHYQVGVFNGQGINHADKNKFKDLIGGLWISPLKHLSIGGFGWNGRYTNEAYKEDANMLKRVKRVRWGAGLKYESDWTVRGEYMSSVGRNVKDASLPKYADAWYATLGVPVVKNFKLYGRWDCYRAAKDWASLKTNYGLSANYKLGKNLLFQLNYNFTDDRGLRNSGAGKDSHYNTFDFQVYARF